VTANGWLSILKVICAAMTKHYELARDPARPIEYFPVPRIYTREQPNALTAVQIPIFVAKMKELHPQHYAMVLLGFGIGARPSTLRPLRRAGTAFVSPTLAILLLTAVALAYVAPTFLVGQRDP
jgi:hypothetical protein